MPLDRMSSHALEDLVAQMASNKKEEEMLENYADLYAILKTTEKLERAYVRDDISAKDYEPACRKLIAQFRTLWETLRDAVPDVEQFMATYSMQCPMAAKRLLHSGLPATVEHGKPTSDGGSSNPFTIAETVQHFITVMDSLKLNMVAIDQVYPLLSDLVQSLHRVPHLPPDFRAKSVTKQWLTKLHGRPAAAELSDEEVRQLLFDLESSYNEYMTSLSKAKDH